MRGVLLGLAVVLLAVAGCSGPRAATEMIITVDGDADVRARATAVQVEVFGRSARGEYPSQPTHDFNYPVPITSDGRWGPIVVLFPEDRDPTRIYRVTARALVGTAPFTETRLISGYVEGQTLRFSLYLQSSCEGVACDLESTCRDGGCVPAYVDPLSLLEGGVTMDGGARDGAPSDATMDGRIDSGADAGPTGCDDCDDGMACTQDRCDTTLDRCVHEVACDDSIDCTVDDCDGAGACTHAPMDELCTGGTDCEVGTCDVAEGRCVYAGDDDLCEDGMPCTDDVCGPSGCTFPPVLAGTSCADATFCDGTETCDGTGACIEPGDPCPGASTCDEGMGACTACVLDTDCPADATVYGTCDYADSCDEAASRSTTLTTYACTGGTCRPTMTTGSEPCTRETDGMSCPGGGCTSWTCGNFTGGPCDSSGNQIRSCVATRCSAGTCAGGAPMMETGGACTRGTEGISCGALSCGGDRCEYASTCAESGASVRDCTQPRCASDVCVPDTYVDTGSLDCARSTDGTSCGTCLACSSGACGAPTCEEDATSDMDAGTDASRDAEAGIDSGTDTGLPTGSEGGTSSTGRLMINEIDYDQPGTDSAEFVEIYNAGPGAVSLDGLALVLVNGAGSVEYARATLSGMLAASAYVVVVPPGSAVVSFPSFTLSAGPIQNGSPDGVLLWDTVSRTVVDALSYGGSITSATILAPGAASGVSLVEGIATFVADNNISPTSMCRFPNGTDTDSANIDWGTCDPITPGAAN